MAKRKPRLGTGKRFAAGVKSITKRGYSKDAAKAIMAKAGRKKYGKKRFQKMAARGRKRRSR